MLPRRHASQPVPRPQLFYGWWMVWLGGFLSSLNKTAVNRGFPVFVAPVRESFGASNAAVAFIFALARAQSGPTGLWAGWCLDRWGPRRVLWVGALMSGGGFLALGYSTSLWAFGLLYLLVVTVGTDLGFSYALSAVINNWFYRRKAFAMSAFQAIDSVVPAGLVGVIALAIAAWGWQTTAKVMGLVLLVVLLPLAACITEAPEQRGLTMDGDPPGSVPPPPHPAAARRSRWAPPVWRPPEDYSVRQALRSWAFWNLTGGTALRLLAKTGATVHIIPILASKGVSEQTAAFLLGAQLFLTVPLYLLLGWAADRFPKPPVLMGASLAGTAAFALLASPWQGRGLLLAYVVLFALCDASAPTNWAVVGEYFGRQTFSRLRGYIQFATFPGALGAPVFLGWWYDHHHSYTVPLWLYTIRVPWLAGCRASTRAATVRLSSLVRCPSCAQAGSCCTVYACTERPTAPNDACRDRARDSQTPWRMRSSRTRGGFSRVGSVAGAALAAALWVSWGMEGEAVMAPAGWPPCGPDCSGGHASQPASVGCGFHGAAPPSILW